jgi:NADH:ubiquinone oxidoreductase subunit E
MQSLNLNLINEILKKYPQKKEYLINALHELQNSHPHKYIDDTIMTRAVIILNLQNHKCMELLHIIQCLILNHKG